MQTGERVAEGGVTVAESVLDVEKEVVEEGVAMEIVAWSLTLQCVSAVQQ